MSTATMQNPMEQYYPAEGGGAPEAQRVPFASGTKIQDQFQYEASDLVEKTVAGAKGIFGFAGSLFKGIGAIVNADNTNSDAVADIFSPDGAIGKFVYGLGVSAAHLGIAMPTKMAAHIKVNGIPVVKQAVNVLDKVTFGAQGKLFRAIPGISFVTRHANNVIQGESGKINYNAKIVGFEQSADGKFSVATDANLALAKSFRETYKTANFRDRPKILEDFKIAAYQNYFGDTTSNARRLTSFRKISQISLLTQYVETGRPERLKSATEISNRLDAITKTRKFALANTQKLNRDLKDENGNYINANQFLYEKRIKALKLELTNEESKRPKDVNKINSLKLQLSTANKIRYNSPLL